MGNVQQDKTPARAAIAVLAAELLINKQPAAQSFCEGLCSFLGAELMAIYRPHSAEAVDSFCRGGVSAFASYLPAIHEVLLNAASAKRTVVVRHMSCAPIEDRAIVIGFVVLRFSPESAILPENDLLYVAHLCRGLLLS